MADIDPRELSGAEAERQARLMGWVPEEEWDEERAEREGRRKPSEFLSAEEYIAKVYGTLPILRQTNRQLLDRVGGLESELGETKGALKSANDKLDDIGGLVQHLSRTNKAIGEREYNRGMADAKAARAAAISEGDEAAVDRADATIRDLEDLKRTSDDAPEPREPKDPAEPEPKDPDNEGREKNPEIEKWVKKNPWFMRDRVLHEFMIEEHGRLIKETPGVAEEELLDQAADAARAKFPEKFNINPRRQERRVANPAPAGNRGGDKKTMADVSEEDRKAYRRHKAYMAEHGEDYTEEEFLAGMFPENQGEE